MLRARVVMLWSFLIVLVLLLAACRPTGERSGEGGAAARPTTVTPSGATPTVRSPGTSRGGTVTPQRRTIVIITDTAHITPEPLRPRGKKIAGTPHFEFYAEGGYFPVDAAWFGEQAEVIFEYVANRLGVASDARTALWFERPAPGPCPVRGMAASAERPAVIIYADPHTSKEQLLGVLAHEIGHVLDRASFEGGPAGTPLFREGLATWAAERYYLEWQGLASFDSAVRAAIEESRFVPLSTDDPFPPGLREECLARRDLVYTEWASFVAFLVERYGMEKLQALMNVPAPAVPEPVDRSAAYQEVYGRSFEELEAEWLAALTATPAPPAARPIRPIPTAAPPPEATPGQGGSE